MNAKIVINKVIFSVSALELFTSEIKRYKTVETGGVLLGYVKDDTIFVVKASDAGPNAVHDEVNFRADPDYIDMFIDIEYANSEGQLIYIGEWHTHPQIIPKPSIVDLQSLDEIAVTTKNFAFLLIIGAIHFTSDSFTEQSVALLEYNNGEDIYELEVNVSPE